MSTATGLELFNLDSLSSQLLIPQSEENGDFWHMDVAKGGVVAHGHLSGHGEPPPIELAAWFIPNGPSPKPRRLGMANYHLDEPSGGVWLVNVHEHGVYLYSGKIQLVDTHGRVRRTAKFECCLELLAPAGGGRFVAMEDQKYLILYDAFSKTKIRRLHPTEIDPVSVRVEGSTAVWLDCPAGRDDDCTDHYVNLETGVQNEQPERKGIVSPDGKHVVKNVREEQDRGDYFMEVDGKPLENSVGFDPFWSVRSDWLLFLRAGRRYLGIWRVGDPTALTVNHQFGYFGSELAAFD